MENLNMQDKDTEFIKDIAHLWMDTVKEHGRDYDNSKQEIGDFFLKLLGIGTSTMCHYKVGEKVLYYHGSKGWIFATVTWIGHEKVYQDFEWGKDENGNSIRINKSPKYYLPTRIEITLDDIIINEDGEHKINIPLTYYHEENKPIEIDLAKTNFIQFPKTDHRLLPDERPYLLLEGHRKYISADSWGNSHTSLRLCKIKKDV